MYRFLVVLHLPSQLSLSLLHSASCSWRQSIASACTPASVPRPSAHCLVLTSNPLETHASSSNPVSTQRHCSISSRKLSRKYLDSDQAIADHMVRSLLAQRQDPPLLLLLPTVYFTSSKLLFDDASSNHSRFSFSPLFSPHTILTASILRDS